MKKILMYDDDEHMLLVCKIILEKENYQVQTRRYCDKVIEEINYFNPDIILMDLWIPEMGGEKAINLIKEDKNIPQIPVILFSANDNIEAICKKTNANGFLKKPFDNLKLKKIIKDHIRN